MIKINAICILYVELLWIFTKNTMNIYFLTAPYLVDLPPYQDEALGYGQVLWSVILILVGLYSVNTILNEVWLCLMISKLDAKLPNAHFMEIYHKLRDSNEILDRISLKTLNFWYSLLLTIPSNDASNDR